MTEKFSVKTVFQVHFRVLANSVCNWTWNLSLYKLTSTNGTLLSRARLGRHFLCPLVPFYQSEISQNWPIEQIIPFSQSFSHWQKVTHYEAAQSLARNETREKRKKNEKVYSRDFAAKKNKKTRFRAFWNFD